jgi:hypothetical protein
VIIYDFINENKPLQLSGIYFHFIHFRSLVFCSIADTLDMVDIKAQNLKDAQERWDANQRNGGMFGIVGPRPS